MKNHWLNKKKDKQEEAILDAVCNEMATGEITIGAGWSSNDVKTEDITWDNVVFNCQQAMEPLCISASPYPLEEKQFSTLVSTNYVEPDPAISSITITNDWSIFETALAEMDMEIGDGSIKYVRETTIGTFTFKDAGALGVDIFSNGTKIGWLNNKGEESLKQWLGEKSVAQENVSVMGKTYTIGIVSNEIVEVACVDNTYQLKNKNIVPCSFILTAYVNGVALQSENLMADGTLSHNYYGRLDLCHNFSHNYACDRPAISEAKLDHNTGLITVNWINFHPTTRWPLGNRFLSVCYEYKDYEGK